MEITQLLKEYWIIVILFLFGIAVIFVVGSERLVIDCSTMEPKYCEKNEDCVCMDNGCFLGNKKYYDECVDKSQVCYDFCYGWGQPTPTCVAQRCVMRYPIY